MKKTKIKYLMTIFLLISTLLFFIGTTKASSGWRNATSYTLLEGSHHMGTLSDTYSDNGIYLSVSADDYTMWSWTAFWRFDFPDVHANRVRIEISTNAWSHVYIQLLVRYTDSSIKLFSGLDDSNNIQYFNINSAKFVKEVEVRYTNVLLGWTAGFIDIIQIYEYSSGGGGGGGCPILSVYNGFYYEEEGLLDIHDPTGNDVVTTEILDIAPISANHRYHLRLTEHQLTISDIDTLQLRGLLHDGRIIPLTLISATHSALGDVKQTLKFSDENKVQLLGAVHNEGDSEFIDLEFLAFKHLNFDEFIFEIEGNNMLVK